MAKSWLYICPECGWWHRCEGANLQYQPHIHVCEQCGEEWTIEDNPDPT